MSPRPIGIAFAAVSGVVALSGVAGVVAALSQDPAAWAWAGFEAVIVVTGLLGVLVGAGITRDNLGLILLCLGGSFAASATFGRFGATMAAAVDGTPTGLLRGLIADPWFSSRAAIGLALMAGAAAVTLGTERRAWGKLVIGLVLGLPVLAAGGWLVASKGAGVFVAVRSGGDIARLIGGLFGSLTLAILASVSVHLVIRAFEIGVETARARAPGRGQDGGPA